MNPSKGKRVYLLQNIHSDSVVHPAFYSMAPGSFSRVTQLGLEVHHSPPPSAGVIRLHGMERDKFTYRIRGWVGPRAINCLWYPPNLELSGPQGLKLSLVLTELGAEWAPEP